MALDIMKVCPQYQVGTDPATQKNMRLEDNILGSGAFKIVASIRSWSTSGRCPKDNFKDGLPYFDAMNYYIVNDSSGIVDACKAEQVPKLTT